MQHVHDNANPIMCGNKKISLVHAPNTILQPRRHPLRCSSRIHERHREARINLHTIAMACQRLAPPLRRAEIEPAPGPNAVVLGDK